MFGRFMLAGKSWFECSWSQMLESFVLLLWLLLLSRLLLLLYLRNIFCCLMRILCGLSASLTEPMFIMAEFRLFVLSLLSSKKISFVLVEFVLFGLPIIREQVDYKLIISFNFF